MRRLLLVVLLIAALCTWAALHVTQRSLPRFAGKSAQRAVGSFHVHSDASHDGRVPLDAIAHAAAQAGLDFVVVADHNAQLPGPVQIDGVTILSHAELSTPFGHVIGLGAAELLDQEARKRRDLVDAMRARGGHPILAHPTDIKRPWTGPLVGSTGLEVANIAASLRRHRSRLFLDLVPLLVLGPVRPELALAQAYDRDRRALTRWDDESDPRFVGMCGNDAHGWIDMGLNMCMWLTVLDGPLPDEPTQRPQAILEAITRGRSHCAAGMLGHGVDLTFVARNAMQIIARPGESISETGLDELFVRLPSMLDGRLRLVLLRNGAEVLESAAAELHYPKPLPGTYRVEARVPIPGLLWGETPVSVLYSNRIRVTPAVVENAP